MATYDERDSVKIILLKQDVSGAWVPVADPSLGGGAGMTDEQVQDIVGAMVAANTETGITVVYDDTLAKLNFDASHTHAQDPILTVLRNLLGPPPVTGNWLAPFVSSTTTAVVPLNSLRVSPILVTQATPIDQIAFEVFAGVASSFFRAVVYDDTGSGYPNANLFDSGQVDCSVAGILPTALSLTLQVGLYWIGGVGQGVAPNLRLNNSKMLLVPGTNTGTFAPVTNDAAYVTTGVTGVPPATFPTTPRTTSSNGVRVGVRVA